MGKTHCMSKTGHSIIAVSNHVRERVLEEKGKKEYSNSNT